MQFWVALRMQILPVSSNYRRTFGEILMFKRISDRNDKHITEIIECITEISMTLMT